MRKGLEDGFQPFFVVSLAILAWQGMNQSHLHPPLHGWLEEYWFFLEGNRLTVSSWQAYLSLFYLYRIILQEINTHFIVRFCVTLENLLKLK